MKKIAIGGERLGAGGKLTVDMHNYERSTHNQGMTFRTSMAAGTLVPFWVEIGQPGDTFDIELNCEVLTHPTLGPLFGSFKAQLDIFEAPVRLYHSALMQNATQIGNNMASVLLPQMQSAVIPVTTPANVSNNPDNIQIHPSALLSYLGLRGWGNNQAGANNTRNMNALPLLIYNEIYKIFYANKQEGNGVYLTSGTNTTQGITSVQANGTTITEGGRTNLTQIINTTQIVIAYGAGAAPTLNQIILYTSGGITTAAAIGSWSGGGAGPSNWTSIVNSLPNGVWLQGWQYAAPGQTLSLVTFPLTNIDTTKTNIMASSPTARAVFNSASLAPYGGQIDITGTPGSQQGLCIKTYQSDMFNNWLSITTWTNIQTSTNVQISAGQFTIDSLILAKKVYQILNRVAIAGGTYQDWVNAVYAHQPYSMCLQPVYHGGLSKEVIFQQVISTVQNPGGNQPLGTIGGRGTMSRKHKGGKIRIRCSEHCYLMGIVSLTPRLDYSQGNDWKMYALTTMNDFMKPGLSQIGFQDLITEQMAWWDTVSTAVGTWVQNSAGKQPAWVQYTTALNKCFGNFADLNNEMFMTLNRRYTMNPATGHILDLTTYIDPSKYNFIWAQTSLDAQNFWMQIAIDCTSRRKMSAKMMPNL